MKKLMCSLLLLASQGVVVAQNSLKATVVSENNEPVIGAVISIQNYSNVFFTNDLGYFEATNITETKITIQITSMGFESLIDTIVFEKPNIQLSFVLKESVKRLDEIVVIATRATENTPISYTNISKEEIQKNNVGVDLPILLDQSVSVVTTSDAGAGVGYTGIRIRGSDASRINVTINGIPLNDAESHGTYWVDLPDFASSVENIQIQRGIGTSTNGAGAFGGSINIFTNTKHDKAFGSISNSYGSFNTRKHTLQLGTGTLPNNWAFEGRLSSISSDGYIDRATSNLGSYYLSSSYHSKKTSLQAIIFSGQEKTFQAWYGVPLRYKNSNPTFNPYTYENEIDNYTQSHYQLHFSQSVSKYITTNISAHYTKGKGYYEQYKGAAENPTINYFSKENLTDYGLNSIITSMGDTINETDLIRRRWLDNDFYGLVYSLLYNKNKISLTFGGAANQYYGKHYGEIIWSEYASNSDIRERYYENDALKNDFSSYLKGNIGLTKKINVFADFQIRSLTYSFLGLNNFLLPTDRTVSMVFFNPKAGIQYSLNNYFQCYGFFGIGNKEPNRDDFTNATTNNNPTHETLYNTEIGGHFINKNLTISLNIFDMSYKNQLINTGKLNDVGAPIRQNVTDSYRRGVEMISTYSVSKKIRLNTNITLSTNKIRSFTEFTDNWDTGVQNKQQFENTDIAFSPNTICSFVADYVVFDNDKTGNLTISLIEKYVGKQFIDNTSSNERKLDSYFVSDGRLIYILPIKKKTELQCTFLVRNIFDVNYVSNAWVYRFQSNGYDPVPDDIYTNYESEKGRYNMIGLFPQAGRNYMLSIQLKF